MKEREYFGKHLTLSEEKILDDWLVRNGQPVDRAMFEHAIVRFMPRWRVLQLVDESNYNAPCEAYENYIKKILYGQD